MAQHNPMSEPTGYEQALPALQAHAEKFERAWARVRATHAGRPVDEVRVALAQAFDEEGIKVWSDMRDVVARKVAGES